MTGNIATSAYDATIEPTEDSIIPMSSNTATSASAAGTWEHGPSSGREYVKKRLLHLRHLQHLHFYCILALNVNLM